MSLPPTIANIWVMSLAMEWLDQKQVNCLQSSVQTPRQMSVPFWGLLAASVPAPANQGSSTSDTDIADKLQVLEKKLDEFLSSKSQATVNGQKREKLPKDLTVHDIRAI